MRLACACWWAARVAARPPVAAAAAALMFPTRHALREPIRSLLPMALRIEQPESQSAPQLQRPRRTEAAMAFNGRGWLNCRLNRLCRAEKRLSE